MFGLLPAQLPLLYDAARKWFTVGCLVIAPIHVFIDAPFGRFTPSKNSIFQSDIFIVDGAHFRSSFRPSSLLVGAYLIHYLNRALASPLRTPSRSKSHIIVPLFAVVFNTFNGSLLGSFLSSPSAPQPSAFCAPQLLDWHDSILLNIRRHAKTKGKAKEAGTTSPGEHYAIPHGLLYRYISYPNYFCEWVEWLGFAIAADPRLMYAIARGSWSLPTWSTLIHGPPSAFLPLLSPAWIFLASEIILMYPRAYRGHLWYLNKFGDNYPKERKIVIPFLL
ncbi:hypothetical protein C8F04DRAFT_1118437 [Mycena alexandri]|uniref:3-oxo-5-alpha-steroid 4-dehydrogenase C-terminal domain-containing protein n=1 Tax=Mycena alexandri TaxID=1745969 RepID=A0AAD6SIL2_9AGAR|nr:hypothetical protein C8F04DRAFT_1118437 [Mycena alexandri]